MRPLYGWLAAYFLLIAAAGLSLWQAGVLAHLGWVWTLTAAVVAVGLGVLLALAGRRPAISSD